MDLSKFKHRNHGLIFGLSVAFSVLVWAAVVISVVFAAYGLLIIAGVLIAHAVFLANLRGNGVRITERQFPELRAALAGACAKLGVENVPEAYVIQGGGFLNAFATKLVSRTYVVIYSDLLEKCEGNPKRVEMILAHEVAHIAFGHLKLLTFLLPARMVPWLGAALSRAQEQSCDLAAAHVVGDAEEAAKGLVTLAAGTYAGKVDLSAYQEQVAETGSFWMSVAEVASDYPFLCKRVARVRGFLETGTEPSMPSRNFFGVMFAPVLGAGRNVGGVMLVYIAVIGIMAATLLPTLTGGQERARKAAARAQQFQGQSVQGADFGSNK